MRSRSFSSHRICFWCILNIFSLHFPLLEEPTEQWRSDDSVLFFFYFSFRSTFWLLLGFTEFYWFFFLQILGRCFTVVTFSLIDFLSIENLAGLLNYRLSFFTGFYLVLPSFTGFYWVLLGFTGFYWVSLGWIEFHQSYRYFNAIIPN